MAKHFVWFWHHSIPVPWCPNKRGEKWVSRIVQRELRHYAFKITGIRADWCVSIPQMQEHVAWQADKHADKGQYDRNDMKTRQGKDVPWDDKFLDALTIGDRHMRFFITNPTIDISCDALFNDEDFRRFWPEVEWTKRPGVCEEFIDSDAAASAGCPGKRFRASLQYLPIFVDPLQPVTFQFAGMDLNTLPSA